MINGVTKYGGNASLGIWASIALSSNNADTGIFAFQNFPQNKSLDFPFRIAVFCSMRSPSMSQRKF